MRRLPQDLRADGEVNVIVYVKPDCVQCDATKRRLTQKGIPFQEADATEENTRAALVCAGYLSAPVVFVEADSGKQRWAGYKPDRIDALVGL